MAEAAASALGRQSTRQVARMKRERPVASRGRDGAAVRTSGARPWATSSYSYLKGGAYGLGAPAPRPSAAGAAVACAPARCGY